MKKANNDIKKEINQVFQKIHKGERWYHYKNKKLTYKILDIGVIESTEQISVIYQAEYDRKYY